MLEIDPAYGGVYAGTSLELSPATAEHFNAAARRATGLLAGEFVDFSPGEVFSVACPTKPLPRPAFVEAYGRLRAVIDDEIEIRLADHPHLFSADADDADLLRGVPTYIPKSLMPEGFFGRPHRLALYDGERRAFGPAERLFHSLSSGAVFDRIEDGPGRLVLEVRGDLDALAARGEVVFFTAPSFGDPRAVVQVEDDGAARRLDWRLLGRDRIGDVVLFTEWIALGVVPRGPFVTLEVHFPERGVGLAAALYAGHTRDTAFRADASVL